MGAEYSVIFSQEGECTWAYLAAGDGWSAIHQKLAAGPMGGLTLELAIPLACGKQNGLIIAGNGPQGKDL